jgi:tRNA uridine 5-carboxymethylaminomethyl modification enzyme
LGLHVSGLAVNPGDRANSLLTEWGTAGLKDRVMGDVLLRRPQMDFAKLREISGDAGLDGFTDDEVEQVTIKIKYEGYIKRDLEVVNAVREAETTAIPSGFDFSSVKGLSSECRMKLLASRPETIGQAGRIQGITPAAVAAVMIAVRSGQYLRSEKNV